MDGNTTDNSLYPAAATADDQFYDTAELNRDFNNANIENKQRTPEEDPQREEWQAELDKLEDEILTLRQVLSAKVKASGEIKRKLGITPMVEMKQELRYGMDSIKSSDAYKKTSQTLSAFNQRITDSPSYQKTSTKLHDVSDKISSTDAYQKTNEAFKAAGNRTASAFSSMGAFASKKIGDMRNSNTFKSFEEKMGGAVSNVKSKVRGSQSEQNFNDALAEENTRSSGAASVPVTPIDEKKPLS